MKAIKKNEPVQIWVTWWGYRLSGMNEEEYIVSDGTLEVRETVLMVEPEMAETIIWGGPNWGTYYTRLMYAVHGAAIVQGIYSKGIKSVRSSDNLRQFD